MYRTPENLDRGLQRRRIHDTLVLFKFILTKKKQLLSHLFSCENFLLFFFFVKFCFNFFLGSFPWFFFFSTLLFYLIYYFKQTKKRGGAECHTKTRRAGTGTTQITRQCRNSERDT